MKRNLREVSDVKSPRKKILIYSLQYRHRLKRYIRRGRICYDIDEFAQYEKKGIRRGRPPKNID